MGSAVSNSVALLANLHCAALAILGNIATATQPPTCRSAPTSLAAPPYVDRDGTLLPQDLPDILSELTGFLPQNLDRSAFMETEGGTYFWCVLCEACHSVTVANCQLRPPAGLGRQQPSSVVQSVSVVFTAVVRLFSFAFASATCMHQASNAHTL